MWKGCGVGCVVISTALQGLGGGRVLQNLNDSGISWFALVWGLWVEMLGVVVGWQV